MSDQGQNQGLVLGEDKFNKFIEDSEYASSATSAMISYTKALKEQLDTCKAKISVLEKENEEQKSNITSLKKEVEQAQNFELLKKKVTNFIEGCFPQVSIKDLETIVQQASGSEKL